MQHLVGEDREHEVLLLWVTLVLAEDVDGLAHGGTLAAFIVTHFRFELVDEVRTFEVTAFIINRVFGARPTLELWRSYLISNNDGLVNVVGVGRIKRQLVVTAVVRLFKICIDYDVV